MLQIKHLSVTRGKRTILSDICFSPRQGKITALLGKNGSGKTTLLSCINRLCPYSGDILLNGTSLSHLSPRERARQIALFPQILPDTPLTVRELTDLGRNPHVGPDGRLSPRDHEAVVRAMTLAGISHLADRPCNTLSGGERQRAFLALLLAQDSPILLLDEPATFLDADAARELYALIASLARDHGKTVVAVMHDLSAAVSLADDILLLDSGHIAFSGDARRCLDSGILQSTFSVSIHRCEDGNIFFR